MVGNPPGAAPDEPAHYLRALAAGRGEVLVSTLSANGLEIGAGICLLAAVVRLSRARISRPG